MTYCWKCPMCTHRMESPTLPVCTGPYADKSYGNHFAVDMKRDYQAEGVGLGSGVKVSRDGTNLDMARLFLPGNDEFAGPGDPDGTKGAKNWLETHQPKHPGGSNPLLKTERNTF